MEAKKNSEKVENYFFQNTPVSKRRRNNLIAMLGAGLGVAFMGNLVQNYLSYYYTEFMLLDAALVSSIMSVGILVDGLSDYFMGAVIDRVRTKYGKVRHWFLWMTIPAAASSMLIFLCPESWSTTAKMVYLFVIYNVYCTCLTAVRLPSVSMLSVGFNDPGVRRQAGVVSGLSGQLGSAISSMTIAPLLAVMGGGIIAYRTTSFIYGGIGALLCLSAFFLLKEVIGSKAAVENVRLTEGEAAAEQTRSIMEAEGGGDATKKKKRNLLSETIQLFKNKYWVIHQVTTISNSVASGFIIGTCVYFCRYVVGDVNAAAGVYGVMSGGMMLGIFGCTPLLLKFDSRVVAVVGSFISFAGMIMAAVGVFVLHINAVLFAGIFFKQLGTGFVVAVDNDLAARTIDYGEWKFGVRLDGLAFSGKAVMAKISSAFATAALGFALSASGYVGGQGAVSDAVILTLQILFVVIPAVTLSFSGILFCFFNLTDSKIREIRAEIAERSKN